MEDNKNSNVFLDEGVSTDNDDTGQKTIKEIQTDTPSSKINQDLNSFYSKRLILKYIFDAKEKAIETIKSRQNIGVKNGEENSPKEENTNQRKSHLGGSSETHQNASIKKMVNVAQACSNLDENFLKGKFSGMIQDFFKASKGLSAKELDVLEKYIKEKQKDINENFASDYQKFINSFFTKEEFEKLSGTPQDLEYRLKNLSPYLVNKMLGRATNLEEIEKEIEDIERKYEDEEKATPEDDKKKLRDEADNRIDYLRDLKNSADRVNKQNKAQENLKKDIHIGSTQRNKDFVKLLYDQDNKKLTEILKLRPRNTPRTMKLLSCVKNNLSLASGDNNPSVYNHSQIEGCFKADMEESKKAIEKAKDIRKNISPAMDLIGLGLFIQFVCLWREMWENVSVQKQYDRLLREENIAIDKFLDATDKERKDILEQEEAKIQGFSDDIVSSLAEEPLKDGEKDVALEEIEKILEENKAKDMDSAIAIRTNNEYMTFEEAYKNGYFDKPLDEETIKALQKKSPLKDSDPKTQKDAITIEVTDTLYKAMDKTFKFPNGGEARSLEKAMQALEEGLEFYEGELEKQLEQSNELIMAKIQKSDIYNNLSKTELDEIKGHINEFHKNILNGDFNAETLGGNIMNSLTEEKLKEIFSSAENKSENVKDFIEKNKNSIANGLVNDEKFLVLLEEYKGKKIFTDQDKKDLAEIIVEANKEVNRAFKAKTAIFDIIDEARMSDDMDDKKKYIGYNYDKIIEAKNGREILEFYKNNFAAYDKKYIKRHKDEDIEYKGSIPYEVIHNLVKTNPEMMARLSNFITLDNTFSKTAKKIAKEMHSFGMPLHKDRDEFLERGSIAYQLNGKLSALHALNQIDKNLEIFNEDYTFQADRKIDANAVNFYKLKDLPDGLITNKAEAEYLRTKLKRYMSFKKEEIEKDDNVKKESILVTEDDLGEKAYLKESQLEKKNLNNKLQEILGNKDVDLFDLTKSPDKIDVALKKLQKKYDELKNEPSASDDDVKVVIKAHSLLRQIELYNDNTNVEDVIKNFNEAVKEKEKNNISKIVEELSFIKDREQTKSEELFSADEERMLANIKINLKTIQSSEEFEKIIGKENINELKRIEEHLSSKKEKFKNTVVKAPEADFIRNGVVDTTIKSTIDHHIPTDKIKILGHTDPNTGRLITNVFKFFANSKNMSKTREIEIASNLGLDFFDYKHTTQMLASLGVLSADEVSDFGKVFRNSNYKSVLISEAIDKYRNKQINSTEFNAFMKQMADSFGGAINTARFGGNLANDAFKKKFWATAFRKGVPYFKKTGKNFVNGVNKGFADIEKMSIPSRIKMQAMANTAKIICTTKSGLERDMQLANSKEQLRELEIELLNNNQKNLEKIKANRKEINYEYKKETNFEVFAEMREPNDANRGRAGSFEIEKSFTTDITKDAEIIHKKEIENIDDVVEQTSINTKSFGR